MRDTKKIRVKFIRSEPDPHPIFFGSKVESSFSQGSDPYPGPSSGSAVFILHCISGQRIDYIPRLGITKDFIKTIQTLNLSVKEVRITNRTIYGIKKIYFLKNLIYSQCDFFFNGIRIWLSVRSDPDPKIFIIKHCERKIMRWFPVMSDPYFFFLRGRIRNLNPDPQPLRSRRRFFIGNN